MRVDFRLEDWMVRPLRDCIERGDEVIHIHPKPMAVLEALAAANGEVVTRDELFEKVWPGVIVTDDALTQCVVELRKAFGDSAQEARIIKTVPRVGFCLVPPVIFMDADELPGEWDERLPGTRNYRKPIRWTALVIAAGILLALVGRLVEDAPIQPETVPPIAIAVLPFTDLSEEGDQQWFADGLAEELIHMLARVQGLNVTNRTSSFHFRDPDEDLRVIADTLGVSHVLEGGVRRDGEQLRVTAQLIDAGSGFNLWSEAWDRELQNIFVVQREIAQAVVDSLRTNLELGHEAATNSREAHDALLLGRYLIAKRTHQDIEGAVAAFENALEFDPDYALAHGELALAIRLLRYYGGDMNITEARRKVKDHAERALALDSEIAEAYAALAWTHDDLGQELALYEQALRIDPSYAMAHHWKAAVLGDLGHYQEAFTEIETALDLDPLSIPTTTIYIRQLVMRGRLDDAESELVKLAYLSPTMEARSRGFVDSVGGKTSKLALGYLEASMIDPGNRLARGRLASALAEMSLEQEALTISDTPSLSVLKKLGRTDDISQRLEDNTDWYSETQFRRRDLGVALAAVGNFDRAQPVLEPVWAGTDNRVAMEGRFNWQSAAALHAINKASGNETTANELLAAMGDDVRRLRAAGVTGTRDFSLSVDFQEGLWEFLSDYREKGLALITTAVDKGFFVLPNEAYLQTLYDDPGFPPIMARQRARQTRERESFLAAVCNDNPYQEVWQPAMETCQQFLANQPTN